MLFYVQRINQSFRFFQETVERMKDLNSRNEQILKENEKTLKEAGKRLLDKVAEFTKELGTEGIHTSSYQT